MANLNEFYKERKQLIVPFILNLCQKAGMRDSDIAKELGLSHSAIDNWKSGKSLPSIEAIIKLSHFFDMPAGMFLGMPDYTSWWNKDLPTDTKITPELMLKLEYNPNRNSTANQHQIPIDIVQMWQQLNEKGQAFVRNTMQTILEPMKNK